MGCQDGETRYEGLVDCASNEEFDTTFDVIRAKWDDMEKNLSDVKRFSSWFLKYQSQVI